MSNFCGFANCCTETNHTHEFGPTPKKYLADSVGPPRERFTQREKTVRLFNEANKLIKEQQQIIDELQAMLRKHEWVDADGVGFCPECEGAGFHGGDCALAKLLGGRDEIREDQRSAPARPG